jgi:hypothetical protein
VDGLYVKGELNKVADCLLRYYESDTFADVHDTNEYVRADARIDPLGEDLPSARFLEVQERVIELSAMREHEHRRSAPLKEQRESRELEAQIMEDAAEASSMGEPNVVDTPIGELPDMVLGDALLGRAGIPEPVSRMDDVFLQRVKLAYTDDKLFASIMEKPDDYKGFTVKDTLIWTLNQRGDEVLCIPRARELVTEIIDQAHDTLGHYGDQRTAEYICRWYWWPLVARDACEFCKTCEACQRAKVSNQQPAGKLHSLPIPTKPWDSIGMDFVGPFPESHGFNYLWVIMCRMTSMVHLIPVHTSMTASKLSWIYRREIVWLHGLPSSIVSDRDSKVERAS